MRNRWFSTVKLCFLFVATSLSRFYIYFVRHDAAAFPLRMPERGEEREREREREREEEGDYRRHTLSLIFGTRRLTFPRRERERKRGEREKEGERERERERCEVDIVKPLQKFCLRIYFTRRCKVPLQVVRARTALHLFPRSMQTSLSFFSHFEFAGCFL